MSSPPERQQLEQLWKHVLDHWEEDAAHGVFLEHCRQHSLLPEAAARYRGMAGDHERGELARKRLQGVAVLALAQLEASRTPPPARSSGRYIGWTLVVLFLAGSVALLRHLGAG